MQLVTRAEWGAAAPRDGILGLTPTYGTTGHYNGPDIWSGRPIAQWDHASCPTKVRGIQAFHMGPARGWLDIAYNHLICPHGYTFEGRGFDRRSAGNGTNEGNATSLAAMLLIGGTEPVTGAMADEFARYCQHARTVGAGPNVGPHDRWISTDCPGGAGSQLVERVAAGWTPDPPSEPRIPDIQPPITIVSGVAAPDGQGGWLLMADGGVYTLGAAPFHGSPVGHDFWEGRQPASITLRDDGQDGYYIFATSKERYAFPLPPGID